MKLCVSSGKGLAGAAVLFLFAICNSQIASAERQPKHSTIDTDFSFHRGNWPFTPPARPALPHVARTDWPANPIDYFIAARLQNVGLSPSQRAGKAALLRRVTFDLTGLPPTDAELKAFLADHSDLAYTHVVDRLLASPRFGERSAQFWLDLVRYAETEGFKSDRLRENAFRYRDYVIDSFNADRPYDEFIRQQLAGDEIEPENNEALIATGFLRLYPDEDNAANLFQRRQEILDDVTDTTSLVFLGLTMGCAQCHDHKFDDISQADYYRLQAFFASIVQQDEHTIADTQEIADFHARLSRWEKVTASTRSKIDRLLKPAHEKLKQFYLEKYEPAILNCYLKPATERSPLEEQIARMIEWRLDLQFQEKGYNSKLSKEEQAQYEALKSELATFHSLRPKPLPKAMAISDVGPGAPLTHVLEGGNWTRAKNEVDPGFPEFLGDASASTVPIKHSRPEPATRRRGELANWLTRRDHPLTSRVIVNRLWQQHFGRGIVATPNDFGLQGEQPTHPELLDWLAVELVENGWSLKHIHRLMVTSATYQMTSFVNPNDPHAAQAMKIDRENKLLWRANRHRLEGETIRDAMLQVAGDLNLRMHGPSCRPELPDGVSHRYAWEPDKDPRQRNRRSIYVLAKRNLRYPLFESFDQPDLHQSCPRRAVTVTAPQALAMLNSKVTLELAQHWARRLIAAHSDNPLDIIRCAYKQAFNRPPTRTEIELAEKFLRDERRLASAKADHGSDRHGGETGVESLAAFCHALFNTNEFITVD
jgi:hypothetical protein